MYEMLAPRLTRAADPLRFDVGCARSVIDWCRVPTSGIGVVAAVARKTPALIPAGDADVLAVPGDAVYAARYEDDLRRSDGECPSGASECGEAAVRAVLPLSGLAAFALAELAETVPGSPGLDTGENAEPERESRLRCREVEAADDDDATAPDRLGGGVDTLYRSLMLLLPLSLCVYHSASLPCALYVATAAVRRGADGGCSQAAGKKRAPQWPLSKRCLVHLGAWDARPTQESQQRAC